MVYPNAEDFDLVFEVIYERLSRKQPAPNYSESKDSVNSLVGVITASMMDNFYPSFFDKLTYLFLEINLGHFYQNGNKRLALVFGLFFIIINDYEINPLLSKEYFKEDLQHLFPNFGSFEDDPDFSPEEFGFYNLCIIAADKPSHQSTFEELKGKVRRFFKDSILQSTKVK